MPKLINNLLNKASVLISFVSVVLLADEIILFLNGRRLDWLSELNRYYPVSIRQNNTTVYLDRSYSMLNGWSVSPGKHKSEEDPSVVMTVWPSLMRACRSNPDKKAEINVAFINGSYTFGEGVRDRDTMVWRLNERYPDVVFDNYAVPGYGPLQCGEHLKKYVFPAKHYDLVCYNINEGNIFVNAYPHAQQGSLKTNRFYIIAPYSAKDCFGRWHNYNSFNSGFTLNARLLTSDLFYRVYLARTGSYDYTAHHKDPKDKIRDAYVHQVQELENLCRSHHTDFAACALEPLVPIDIFPNLTIKGSKVDISFADIYETEYRVLRTPGFHPNAAVHACWAEKFSEWFDGEYLPKKSKH